MADRRYTALGIMSGSSMDGIDVALCTFWQTENRWNFEIAEAETITLSDEWQTKLRLLTESGAEELTKQDILFGKYLGQLATDFLEKHHLKADIIASHGHTLFHRPDEGFTFQLGSGQAIAKNSELTTISNFRQKDVLYGGQGAPLVPIGDLLLFPETDFCINLGGIANISVKENDQIYGFDISPANQLLNHLSQQLGQAYDDQGKIARNGKLIPSLFETLNQLPYFSKSFPKSLGNEDVRSVFIPLLDKSEASVEDKLHTTVRHITYQIGKISGNNHEKNALVTGGGAHNSFLLEALKDESNISWIIPDRKLIDFKEALVFAFMGVLKMKGEINCLSSVTGASKDTSSGDIFQP